MDHEAARARMSRAPRPLRCRLAPSRRVLALPASARAPAPPQDGASGKVNHPGQIGVRPPSSRTPEDTPTPLPYPPEGSPNPEPDIWHPVRAATTQLDLLATCPDCGAPLVPVKDGHAVDGAELHAIVQCSEDCGEFVISVHMRRYTRRPLPLEPLLRLVGGSPGRDAQEWKPAHHLADRLALKYPHLNETARRTRVYRWRRNGLTVREADELATLLGQHPSAIWPEWYEVEDLSELPGLA